MNERLSKLILILNKYTIEEIQILSIVSQKGLNITTSKINENGVTIQRVGIVDLENTSTEKRLEFFRKYADQKFSQKQISLIESAIREINEYDSDVILNEAIVEIAKFIDLIDENNILKEIQRIEIGFNDADETVYVSFSTSQDSLAAKMVEFDYTFQFNTIKTSNENFNPEYILEEILEFSVNQEDGGSGEEYGTVFQQIYTLRVLQILKSAIQHESNKNRLHNYFGSKLQIVSWVYPEMDEFVILEFLKKNKNAT